jgi:hypothetical protein
MEHDSKCNSSAAVAGDAGQTAARPERRKFPRYRCHIGVSGEQEPDNKRLWAECSDISIGGCYLETWTPSPVGANIALHFDDVTVTASVVTSHPNVGMGVRFTNVSDADAFASMMRHACESC